jgi:hypothetical protein
MTDEGLVVNVAPTGSSRLEEDIARVFGKKGEYVFVDLVGGGDRHGELEEVFLGGRNVPFAVRVNHGGLSVLIPWHAIQTYTVRGY